MSRAGPIGSLGNTNGQGFVALPTTSAVDPTTGEVVSVPGGNEYAKLGAYGVRGVYFRVSDIHPDGLAPGPPGSNNTLLVDIRIMYWSSTGNITEVTINQLELQWQKDTFTPGAAGYRMDNLYLGTFDDDDEFTVLGLPNEHDNEIESAPGHIDGIITGYRAAVVDIYSPQVQTPAARYPANLLLTLARSAGRRDFARRVAADGRPSNESRRDCAERVVAAADDVRSDCRASRPRLVQRGRPHHG